MRSLHQVGSFLVGNISSYAANVGEHSSAGNTKSGLANGSSDAGTLTPPMLDPSPNISFAITTKESFSIPKTRGVTRQS